MKHGADLANLSNKELLSSNYSLLFLVEMLKLCVLPHGFPFLEPNRNLSAPISLDCFIFQSRSSLRSSWKLTSSNFFGCSFVIFFLFFISIDVAACFAQLLSIIATLMLLLASHNYSLPLQKGHEHDVNEADLLVSPLYTCRHIFHIDFNEQSQCSPQLGK